jgi:hypothetical protein
MAFGPAEAFTPEQFAELYDINVLSTQRICPPIAAKAAMDSLGTNHFVHAGAPADVARAAEYNEKPYAGVPEQALKGLASLEPPEADARAVAEAIVRVVETPFGKRPFRTHVDPSQDGAEIVNGVADRVRAEMFRRIGLEDLLSPRVSSGQSRRR